jgi:hypothetical protein
MKAIHVLLAEHHAAVVALNAHVGDDPVGYRLAADRHFAAFEACRTFRPTTLEGCAAVLRFPVKEGEQDERDADALLHVAKVIDAHASGGAT